MPRLALLALVLLTGCVTAQDTLTGVEAEPRRRFLTFAGYQSPVLLISVNAPFQLPQPDIAVRLTEHANGSVVGSDVTYTATAAQAKHANYRIVARFDAEQGTDTKDVCKSAFGPTPAARYADRTNLFMAFCDNAEPIAGAKVSGPKLAGLSDPNLREMLRAGMQAMFPSATNSGRTGSMGSIQVNPVPHFRLNPLDGII
ncbi:hypothetical protein BAL199_20385 [alpha proteobacterium BAL199]|jgi:ABC-type amino acid transport substrate-binding protein|nr:hypothetical protein BAL199_20385 [alpha proteobacterium BAL199]